MKCWPWSHDWGPPEVIRYGLTVYSSKMCRVCCKIKRREIGDYIHDKDLNDLKRPIVKLDEKGDKK